VGILVDRDHPLQPYAHSHLGGNPSANGIEAGKRWKVALNLSKIRFASADYRIAECAEENIAYAERGGYLAD